MWKRVGLVVALVVAVGVIGIAAWGSPPNVAPRGTFTELVIIDPVMVTSCGTVCLPVRYGIDGNGPYFAFNVNHGGTTVEYTYRARNDECGTCNVAYFGDGRIAAVNYFREMFERYRRSGLAFAGPPPGPPPCGPLFGYNCPGFTGPVCSATVVFTPRDYMYTPFCTSPPPGGPQLLIVVDPATKCFEDFEFKYNVP